MDAPSAGPFVRFIGVYDADGGLLGELRYVAGKLLGTSRCALCDITHGLDPRGKAAWRRCLEGFPVPLSMVHRNEQAPALEQATRGALPCVVGERADGSFALVADRAALEACRGDVGALEALLRRHRPAAPGA